MSALDEHIDTPARTSGYRYSPHAWAVACDRSQARADRRRRRLRRYAIALNVTVLVLALVALALVWWLA